MNLAQLQPIPAALEAEVAPPMDPCTACMICEGVEQASLERQIQAWQYLIDTGLVWSLQGWYGRAAKALIEGGRCHA